MTTLICISTRNLIFLTTANQQSITIYDMDPVQMELRDTDVRCLWITVSDGVCEWNQIQWDGVQKSCFGFKSVVDVSEFGFVAKCEGKWRYDGMEQMESVEFSTEVWDFFFWLFPKIFCIRSRSHVYLKSLD